MSIKKIESPTLLLHEFLSVFKVQINTKDNWDMEEVLRLMLASENYALNRYVERLEQRGEGRTKE